MIIAYLSTANSASPANRRRATKAISSICFAISTSNIRPNTVVMAMKSITTLGHLQEMFDTRKLSYRLVGPLTPLEPGWIHLLADDRYFDFSFRAGDLTVITENAIVRKQAPLKRGRYRSVVQNTKRLVSVNDLQTRRLRRPLRLRHRPLFGDRHERTRQNQKRLHPHRVPRRR
ncbi:MAG: hypothetical protein MZU97_15105 [Bacillus subtilis]|nr:hypothetical protein [Bacillus subtilis]